MQCGTGQGRGGRTQGRPASPRQRQGEADPVQHRTRTDGGGHPIGRAGREAERGIGFEQRRHDESYPVGAKEQQPPGTGPSWVEGSSDADRECDEEQAGDDEVCDLDPAGLSEAEEARWMVGETEPGPGHGLDRHEDQEEWPAAMPVASKASVTPSAR
jgi:hypothetical protein